MAGSNPYVLAVHDLASGCIPALQSLSALTEEVTRAVLGRLSALHGAPLILKVHNGSAFRALASQVFWHGSGAIPLYSPPGCSRYNEAAEAALGSFNKRPVGQARVAGRGGR
jgi:hypothetical protein